MGEFGVSDKEARKNSSSVKVQKQNLEAFPSKPMMMMVPLPHNHHYPSLSPFDNNPSFAADDGDGDGDGPTTYMSFANHTNHFVNAHFASGAALVRPLQPFHVANSTAFNSSGGMMAASLGFPFTNAQWKELERQALIYKYMMASVPVPPHLLIPMAASRSPLDSSYNLRFSSSSDAEPGRCRRTDGKKWRCSREVAPNHKYCERHMHRGRPRSRKPVEIQANTSNNQQIKMAPHDYPSLSSIPTVTISNSAISNHGSSSQFLVSTTTSQPYFESSSSLSLDNLGVKAANIDSLASVSSNKEPRGLDSMLKEDPTSMAASDPEWHPLIQNKFVLSTCTNHSSISAFHHKDPLYMNSYDLSSSALEQQNKRSPLYANPLSFPQENHRSVKPRGFIDAWSNAETREINANKRDSVALNAKLSLSCIVPLMGGGLDEDNGNTHMAPPAPWVASSTPGGPLAEVLRPSTVATPTNETPSNSSSPVSPVVTVVSSPSGVLQKTFASLSDSSCTSSPRVASSRANSEMPLLCLSRPKAPSSS